MAIRPIVVYPHAALLAPTEEVTVFDEDLRRLVDDMVETMHADHGIGLAANQVADRRRLFILDLSGGEDPEALRVYVNPRILEQRGSQTGEEGCLSFPGFFEVIERPQWIRFSAVDLEGRPFEETAEDLAARAVCHEVDHLDGKVFLERMSPLKRRLARRKIDKLRQNGEWPEQVLAG